MRTSSSRPGRTRLIADEADRLFQLFRRRALRQPPEIEEAMGHQTNALGAQLDVTITNGARLLEQVEYFVDLLCTKRLTAALNGRQVDA